LKQIIPTIFIKEVNKCQIGFYQAPYRIMPVSERLSAYIRERFTIPVKSDNKQDRTLFAIIAGSTFDVA
jgi:hypothetical protein